MSDWHNRKEAFDWIGEVVELLPVAIPIFVLLLAIWVITRY